MNFTKFSVETVSADQNSTKTQDRAESRALTKLELALMSSKGYDKKRLGVTVDFRVAILSDISGLLQLPVCCVHTDIPHFQLPLTTRT